MKQKSRGGDGAQVSLPCPGHQWRSSASAGARPRPGGFKQSSRPPASPSPARAPSSASTSPGPAHGQAPGEPRALAAEAERAGWAPRKRGERGRPKGPERGRAGRGGTRRGRAGLRSLQPPLGSRAAGGGTRDPARRRRARRGPLKIPGAPPPEQPRPPPRGPAPRRRLVPAPERRGGRPR